MTVREIINCNSLPSSELRQILSCVLKLDTAALLTHPEKEINNPQLEKINALIESRKNGEPLAYVIQNRFFFRSSFYTPEGVLIPQPDTETVVEQAIDTAKKSFDDSCIRILDICAGTGCIGISVAKELSSVFKDVFLTLSDISEKAFEAFSVNADRLITEKNIHITKICGNLFENINDRFNLILSNPPYIRTSVIPTLDSEVQAEPFIALDGGEDGLCLISEIIVKSRNYAMENAYLLMEIGYDQGKDVSSLLKKNSFADVQVFRDLGMRDRVVKAFFK